VRGASSPTIRGAGTGGSGTERLVEPRPLRKVNRGLTEGRQALAIKLAGIEGGIECATLAPLLAALVDGRAGPDDLARLGPHMRSCLSCRARLRSMRTERHERAAGGPAPTVRWMSLTRLRSAA
jgi:hypothetical protein